MTRRTVAWIAAEPGVGKNTLATAYASAAKDALNDALVRCSVITAVRQTTLRYGEARFVVSNETLEGRAHRCRFELTRTN